MIPVLLLTKVKSQIDQLQKDFLGKSNEGTSVLEYTILTQKGLKSTHKKRNSWVLATHC